MFHDLVNLVEGSKAAYVTYQEGNSVKSRLGLELSQRVNIPCWSGRNKLNMSKKSVNFMHNEKKNPQIKSVWFLQT